MSRNDFISLIAHQIWLDMVEGGVSDNSSTEGHWRIAESIVAWFEEADDPDFVLTYAYAKRREDNDRFRELYEQYKKELK